MSDNSAVVALVALVIFGVIAREWFAYMRYVKIPQEREPLVSQPTWEHHVVKTTLYPKGERVENITQTDEENIPPSEEVRTWWEKRQRQHQEEYPDFSDD